MLVDLVADHRQIVLHRDLADGGLHLIGLEGARRVARGVEDDGSRPRRDGRLEALGVDDVPVFRTRLDIHRAAAGRLHHLRVGEPVRGGDQDLVALPDQDLERREEDALGARTNDRSVGCQARVAVATERRGHRLAQGRDARGGGVLRPSVPDGLDRGLLDVVGCIEVGLARGEGGDVDTLGSHLVRAGRDGQGRGRGKTAGMGCEGQHNGEATTSADGRPRRSECVQGGRVTRRHRQFALPSPPPHVLPALDPEFPLIFRSRRFRRLLLILVILGIVLLTAFTWIAYWPLEGSVDRVAGLVPGDVDAVFRTSWQGLKETGWIEENVILSPVVPQLRDFAEQLRSAIDRAKKAQEAGVPLRTPEEVRRGSDGLGSLVDLMMENERRINSQIPLGITTFSFEEDVFGDELVFAHRFCAGTDPRKGPPEWREFVALTRVTWKTKFVAALKHGFVRNNVDPNLQIEAVGDGIFKFTALNVPVMSPRQRQCGDGTLRPPNNVFYMTRVKDVLAVSNSATLIGQVADLGAFPDSGRSYLDRPHVELDLDRGAVAASMDVQPIENYLVRALETYGRPYTILRRYLTVTALQRLNGALLLPSKDQVRAHARIRYHPSQLGPGVGDVYALSPEAPGSAVAGLVPQEDTFAALLLRTQPAQLLTGIFEDILTPAQQQLWRDNLRRMRRYESIEEFFAEFASKLGDTAGIALARLSDPYDTLDYPGFWVDDPEKYPSPGFGAIAMMVHLNRDSSPAELDAYLAERVPLLGGSPELEQVTYRGLTYTRIGLQMEAADFAHVSPAWILAQEHFIFASNETYFRKILDTLVDPKAHPPLKEDPTFRAAMDKLPSRVHVAAFVDLEKLLRVPPSTEPGAQPRGFLWDGRNDWVNVHHNPSLAAGAYRKQRETEIRQRTGKRTLTMQQELELDKEVARHRDDHMTHYRDFLEEYRRDLALYDRLRGLGLGIVADRDILTADLALLFRPPPSSASAVRGDE